MRDAPLEDKRRFIEMSNARAEYNAVCRRAWGGRSTALDAADSTTIASWWTRSSIERRFGATDARRIVPRIALSFCLLEEPASTTTLMPKPPTAQLVTEPTAITLDPNSVPDTLEPRYTLNVYTPEVILLAKPTE